MADIPALPLAQAYYPTTFLERGVAVPFTTPLLSGTRARPGHRGGTELIVPNPSGARGVYILPWNGVRELCRPTVHDACLNDKVAALRSVTPAAIREAARQVAVEGLAGREAKEAALAACEGQRHDRVLTNFLLVMRLAQQIELSGSADTARAGDPVAALEEKARRALSAIAPRLGRSPDVVAGTLEEIAVVFEGVSVGAQSGQARLARAIERLTSLRDETAAWGGAAAGDIGAIARMVADIAEVTLSCARCTLDEAVALTANVPELLRRWESDPAPVIQLAGRTEWLLDGWERICALWASATEDSERPPALTEIAELVPVIPKEAADWIKSPVEDQSSAMRFRRLVSRNEDWRTGSQVLALIERNEHLLAMAA